MDATTFSAMAAGKLLDVGATATSSQVEKRSIWVERARLDFYNFVDMISFLRSPWCSGEERSIDNFYNRYESKREQIHNLLKSKNEIKSKLHPEYSNRIDNVFDQIITLLTRIELAAYFYKNNIRDTPICFEPIQKNVRYDELLWHIKTDDPVDILLKQVEYEYMWILMPMKTGFGKWLWLWGSKSLRAVREMFNEAYTKIAPERVRVELEKMAKID